MVVGKYMGKYPKFKVIDPCNTPTIKKTVKTFSRSQNMSMELLASGHTQILLLIYLTFPDEPL